MGAERRLEAKIGASKVPATSRRETDLSSMRSVVPGKPETEERSIKSRRAYDRRKSRVRSS